MKKEQLKADVDAALAEVSALLLGTGHPLAAVAVKRAQAVVDHSAFVDILLARLSARLGGAPA